MGLLKKLQARLLKGDLAKGKSLEYLAEKYPMSLLIENKVFYRYKDSELYWDKHESLLFNISGECLGEICSFLPEDSKYIIVEDVADYEFTDEVGSYAVYDKSGRCVVPHSCYPLAYQAKDYVILTMPMEDDGFKRPHRLEAIADRTTIMPSTDKTMQETLGGSLQYPKPLVITANEIINLDYMSVCPVPVKEFAQPYDNNMVWIAQKASNQEVTFKFDKRMYITETYRLPMYNHQHDYMFCTEEGTNFVYLLDMDAKKRINLRTGENVNLLNLKRRRLSKAERFAEDTVEEQSIEDVVAFDNVAIGVAAETEAVEDVTLEKEIDQEQPIEDIVDFNDVTDVVVEAEVVAHDDESVVFVQND